MTLHLSQIFFTEARTFIVIPFFILKRKSRWNGSHTPSCMTLNAEAKAQACLEAKMKTWRSGRWNSVSCLLVAVDNAAAVEVVWAELNRDAVAGEDADEVFAHASGYVSKGLMLVLKLNLEHRIWQRLDNHRHHFNCIFLRQTISFGKVGGLASLFPQLLFRLEFVASAGCAGMCTCTHSIS